MFYNYEIFKKNAFNFDISNGIFLRQRKYISTHLLDYFKTYVSF